jgi:hypothetical protein
LSFEKTSIQNQSFIKKTQKIDKSFLNGPRSCAYNCLASIGRMYRETSWRLEVVFGIWPERAVETETSVPRTQPTAPDPSRAPASQDVWLRGETDGGFVWEP